MGCSCDLLTWKCRAWGKSTVCTIPTSFKVNVCCDRLHSLIHIPEEVFRSSFRRFLKDIRSSSLDVGCLLLCSLSAWSRAASLRLRFELWGFPTQDLKPLVKKSPKPWDGCSLSPDLFHTYWWKSEWKLYSWIHHFIRPVTDDFQPPVLVWFNSQSFSPCFSSIKMAPW